MEYHVECLNKNYDLVLTEYKEMPLTQGKTTLVDVEDFEYLNQYKWYCSFSGKKYYVKRAINNKYIYMHRQIMNPPVNMQIDHINGNSLDNRKNNLRICTNAQNTKNRKASKNNTSGYKRVHWDKHTNKWIAGITINRKTKYLGCFNVKEDAAKAYNEAAIKHYKEFAVLNEISERWP